MVNFITIPLKATTEIDFIRPLGNYVGTLSELSSDTKQEINDGIVELNKLRNRVCVQMLDKNQTSLDALTRYYDQLCVMENKLPISPTQNPISFKWKDAFASDKGFSLALFSSSRSLTISDSSFERACVLFNCGALMSAVAGSQQIHTDEELKTTAKLFQQAAGIFARLKDTVLGLVQQEPTTDLMPDTLAALSVLMLAQAQEAIYIKAAKGQMKPSALVKISAQCAEYYQETLRLMSKDVIKGVWEKEWLNSVSGKSLAFSAIAQYHQAQVCEANKEIGEQLTRLKEAHRLMEQCSNYLPLAANFPSESAAIKKFLDQSVKDNDFIYHERIPEFRTVSVLPKAALAKATPVNIPISPRFKDLFSSLVPLSVQNALSAFEARKADVVNVETARMREYTQIMNACLASLNLPAALDDIKNHEKCPESIREKSAKVKASGGVNSIQSKLRELPSLFKRNDEILAEIGRLLKDEKENDEQLRVQFQEKWTRVPSEKLTQPLMQELGKYRGILMTASNADKIVMEKFEANQKGIEILSKTEEQLKAAIPGLSSKTGAENSEAVSKLLELMNQVQQIKVERENIEKLLKQIQFDMSKEFMNSMAENEIVNEEKLLNEKIADLFQSLKENVEQSLKKQETVMAEVEKWNKKFVNEKHGSGSEERENLLKLLATSYDTFFSLEENLNEGTKFYNDLTPILVRLQQKVSDFCFARQTEKEDLMKQVQQNIVSGKQPNTASTTGTIKNPPPRPPPPSNPSTTNTVMAAQGQAPYQNWNPFGMNQQPQQPSVPYQQQQPAPYPQQANPYMPYAQNPGGYAAPQQNSYQPQFQQNYTTPYPIQYPTSYPTGGYQQPPQPQHYGGYPPNPNFPQPPPS